MSKFGVFIDADNVSAPMAESAIKQLERIGEIRFIRAYGNWAAKPSGWKHLVNRYGIESSHRYNITKTKNAADIGLAVDATAILYGYMNFDTLTIVSSDSDFVPLMKHAQSLGMKTVGMGSRKAPLAYTSQCGCFHFLDEPKVMALSAATC